MKKYLFIILGIILLVIGFIGIFMPLLPTTPFLLLAAACFSKSSDKLYNWLTNHKIMGRYIKGYLNERAISLNHKIFSVVFLWATITLTATFAFDSYLWKGILAVIAMGITLHILTLKTLAVESKK